MTETQISILSRAAGASLEANDAVDALAGKGPGIIAALLADRGWSLRELARRLGMSAAYLSRVSRGRDAMSLELAERVYRLVCEQGDKQ